MTKNSPQKAAFFKHSGPWPQTWPESVDRLGRSVKALVGDKAANVRCCNRVKEPCPQVCTDCKNFRCSQARYYMTFHAQAEQYRTCCSSQHVEHFMVLAADALRSDPRRPMSVILRSWPPQWPEVTRGGLRMPLGTYMPDHLPPY